MRWKGGSVALAAVVCALCGIVPWSVPIWVIIATIAASL